MVQLTGSITVFSIIPQLMVSRVENNITVLLLAEFEAVGGTRTFTKQLLNFYFRNKFRVILLARGPVNDVDMERYCNELNVTLLCYQDVSKDLTKGKLLPLRLRKEKKILVNYISELKPDIIVASVGSPVLFLGHVISEKNGIYILHTTPETSSNMSLSRRIIHKLFWLISGPKRCKFVTVSNYAAEKMMKNWGLFGSSKPIVIYNSSGNFVNYFKHSTGCIEVLTVGHVIEYKNPFFWIEIAQQVIQSVPNVRFTWIGPGPLLQDCIFRVREINLDESIRFIGSLDDLNDFYTNCDIYLQPSRIESLGIALLDAMRYGKPCIVSSAGGMPEVVSNEVSGYVINLDEGADKFAKRVIDLALNPEKRDIMGQISQDIYSEKFTPLQWEASMKRLHEEVVKK